MRVCSGAVTEGRLTVQRCVVSKMVCREEEGKGDVTGIIVLARAMVSSFHAFLVSLLVESKNASFKALRQRDDQVLNLRPGGGGPSKCGGARGRGLGAAAAAAAGLLAAFVPPVVALAGIAVVARDVLAPAALAVVPVAALSVVASTDVASAVVAVVAVYARTVVAVAATSVVAVVAPVVAAVAPAVVVAAAAVAAAVAVAD